MGQEEEAQSLVLTPTWVVAAVCLVIIAISLGAERRLHRLGKARLPNCSLGDDPLPDGDEGGIFLPGGNEGDIFLPGGVSFLIPGAPGLGIFFPGLGIP